LHWIRMEAGGVASNCASRIIAQSTSCTSTGTESLQIGA
jgi:hypothetical protein